MKARILNYRASELTADGETLIVVAIPLREGKSFVENAEKIRGGEYVIEIKKPRKSKNMNSYMWVLCDKLAERMPPLTKEDIYRACVQQAGKWVDASVGILDMVALETSWQSNGIGWFCDVLHKGEQEALVRCYIGSSVYDHSELRKLTNYVVDECGRYGIETATPAELDHLEYLWEVN